MEFIAERITTIDTLVFDECFAACKTHFMNNMPWHLMKDISVSDVTETFTRNWALAEFQSFAAKDSDTDGFVFQVKNTETGRVLAMYTARKCINPQMPNTLSLLMVMFNTDEHGSTKNWLSEYFKCFSADHDPLKNMINTIGCTRWFQDIYTQTLLDAVSGDFINNGTVPERGRSRIYSTYGW